MKKVMVWIAALALCLSFAGCSSQQPTATESGTMGSDLELIVYKDITEADTETNLYNIQRLTIIYSWEDGFVDSIVMQYDCATEEDAQGAYDSLLENYSDSLKIDGKRVTYNEDTSIWKYSKYDEVRNSYIAKFWNIIDDQKYIEAMSGTENSDSSETAETSETSESSETSETESSEALTAETE